MASQSMQMDEKTMNAFRNLQNLQAFMMPHLSGNAGPLAGPNLNFPNANIPAGFNNQGAHNQGATFKKRAPPPKKEEEEEDEEGEYRRNLKRQMN
jgi:hypothetical protein